MSDARTPRRPRRSGSLSPDERALRALVRKLTSMGADVTPETVRGLAAIVEHWPVVSGGERR